MRAAAPHVRDTRYLQHHRQRLQNNPAEAAWLRQPASHWANSECKQAVTQRKPSGASKQLHRGQQGTADLHHNMYK